jgi:hypothetical protein
MQKAPVLTRAAALRGRASARLGEEQLVHGAIVRGCLVFTRSSPSWAGDKDRKEGTWVRMTLPSLSARAATARRKRLGSTATPAVLRDPCPRCGVELGGPRAATRRVALFSATPGAFGWRCPDCGGTWHDGASS